MRALSVLPLVLEHSSLTSMGDERLTWRRETRRIRAFRSRVSEAVLRRHLRVTLYQREHFQNPVLIQMKGPWAHKDVEEIKGN